MKRLLPLLMLWWMAAHVGAQAIQDLQLWQGLIVQKTFFQGKLQASLTEEVRLKNNLAEVGNAYTDLSLHYRLVKRLNLGAGYRYSIRPEVNTHRIYTDLTFRPKFESRFSLTLRTRLQHDRNPVETDTYLRPRLNVFYNIKGTKLEPFVGAEPFLFLHGANSLVDSYRIYAGLRYPLRKKVELRLGYILDQELQDPTPSRNHVLSLRFTLDLDTDEAKDAEPEVGW